MSPKVSTLSREAVIPVATSAARHALSIMIAVTVLLSSCNSETDHLSYYNLPVGADRLGEAAVRWGSDLPYQLRDVERVFGIGRFCSSPSREVFLMEEEQTRIDGFRVASTIALPRIVIAGCGSDTAPEPADRSYGFFVSVGAHLTHDPDPLGTSIVEVMALDREGGHYNFYDLRADPAGGTLLTRFEQDVDGTARETAFRLTTGERTVRQRNDGACFACHRVATPLLTELEDPWHRWIGPRKSRPEREYAGETRELADTAAGSESLGTVATGAGVLEAYVRAGTSVSLNNQLRTWMRQARGPLPQTHASDVLLNALLCQIQPQAVTQSASIPTSIFFDMRAIAGSFLAEPRREGVSIIQYPSRGLVDRLIEDYVVHAHALSREVVDATRVLDDENDQFSNLRCGLRRALEQRGLEDWDALLRAELRLHGAAVPMHPAQRAYFDTLLDLPADQALIGQRRAAYFREAAQRLSARVQDLDTPSGAVWLRERIQSRRQHAAALFDGPHSPLPVWPLD